jgi:hypothetical protein
MMKTLTVEQPANSVETRARFGLYGRQYLWDPTGKLVRFHRSLSRGEIDSMPGAGL